MSIAFFVKTFCRTSADESFAIYMSFREPPSRLFDVLEHMSASYICVRHLSKASCTELYVHIFHFCRVDQQDTVCLMRLCFTGTKCIASSRKCPTQPRLACDGLIIIDTTFSDISESLVSGTVPDDFGRSRAPRLTHRAASRSPNFRASPKTRLRRRIEPLCVQLSVGSEESKKL